MSRYKPAYQANRVDHSVPTDPYFRFMRQIEYEAERTMRTSKITVLSGTKCRTEAAVVAEVKGKYPVYVQEVCRGNPRKEIRIGDEHKMSAFLQGIAKWRHTYVVVRHIHPGIPYVRPEIFSRRGMAAEYLASIQ